MSEVQWVLGLAQSKGSLKVRLTLRDPSITTQRATLRLATKRIRRPRYLSVPRQGEDTTREDDLDDGAVEELLFGWLKGKTERGRKQRSCDRHSKTSLSPF